MPDHRDEIDISMTFDLPNAFVTLLYQCKCSEDRENEEVVFVDVEAVQIRATRLTDKGEKVWHYGDNTPAWLRTFMDNHVDEVEKRVKAGLDKALQKRNTNSIMPTQIIA